MICQKRSIEDTSEKEVTSMLNEAASVVNSVFVFVFMNEIDDERIGKVGTQRDALAISAVALRDLHRRVIKVCFCFLKFSCFSVLQLYNINYADS